MAQAVDDYVKELLRYSGAKKGDYQNWCAGVSSQPEDCLINVHHVDPGRDPYWNVETDSPEEARAVLQALFALGFDHNPGEDVGDEYAESVFIYKKGPDTFLKT